MSLSGMKSRWFQNPYCEAFPLAHLMRTAFPECWLRIHSLPGSKRYAESDTERDIVFERHARFGTSLLGERASCLIIQSRLNGFARAEELLPELEWTAIHRIEEEEDEVWESWMARTTWDAEAFRPLLMGIADDRLAHVAFLSEGTDCVYVPYDGGADGFSFDEERVQRMSEEFAEWRSGHALGL